MTGLAWLNEAGLLNAPIALTNTHDVGTVRDALVTAAAERGYRHNHMLPVAAETCDDGMSDATAHHVTARHLFDALESASAGAVAEGNVGGGTGMVCHDFKGGTGTASRIGRAAGQDFTVGALVQANYGSRADLRIDGVPVGREIGLDRVPVPDWRGEKGAGSIIVVLATDLPLLPLQCRRLAQRAGLGLARVGGVGHNGSGDIFLAFSTRQRPADRQHGRADGPAHAAERGDRSAVRGRHRGGRGSHSQRARDGGDDDRPAGPHGARPALRPAGGSDGPVSAAGLRGATVSVPTPSLHVMPAKAGIQGNSSSLTLDLRFRGGDIQR